MSPRCLETSPWPMVHPSPQPPRPRGPRSPRQATPGVAPAVPGPGSGSAPPAAPPVASRRAPGSRPARPPAEPKVQHRMNFLNQSLHPCRESQKTSPNIEFKKCQAHFQCDFSQKHLRCVGSRLVSLPGAPRYRRDRSMAAKWVGKSAGNV